VTATVLLPTIPGTNLGYIGFGAGTSDSRATVTIHNLTMTCDEARDPCAGAPVECAAAVSSPSVWLPLDTNINDLVGEGAPIAVGNSTFVVRVSHQCVSVNSCNIHAPKRKSHQNGCFY
jgi:hypothetical protein